MRRIRSHAMAFLLAVPVLAGCEAGGGGAGAPPSKGRPPEATPERVPWDPALATAVLRVRARLEGEPPRMRPIKFDADPECGKQHRDPVLEETVIVRDGLLANVVVAVTSGADRWRFPAVEGPAVFELKGCMFVPHALAMRTGQPLKIVNLGTCRNCIHAVPKLNPEFHTEPLLKGGPPAIHRFDLPEVGIRVKDDVHGWMNARVSVFDHPFFGITGTDGECRIPVPPGRYEVAAWHEYGRFEAPGPATVEAKAGEETPVEFVYRAPPR